MTVSEGSSLPMQQLEEWFLANGGRIHLAVRISHLAHDGHGYRLERRKIERAPVDEEQSEIVFVPGRICLSFLQIPKIAPWWPSSWIDQQTPTLLTRFLLMESLRLGPSCEFFPYIQCLPSPSDSRPFNTPLYWDATEHAFLQGTNLFFAWEKRSKEWKDEFQNARSDLANLCPDRREHIEQLEERQYIWAATVLTSRCFPGSLLVPEADLDRDSHLAATAIYQKWLTRRGSFTFPILIPILDLANHSPEADVVWDAQEKGVGLKTRLPGQEGAEVFNNYGQKSNEELILGYGFDLPTNPANHFGLSLPVGSSRKLQLIAAAREQSSEGSPFIPSSIPPTAPGLQGDAKSADMSHLGSSIYVLRENTHPLESSAATPLARLAMNSRELRQQCERPQQPPLLNVRFPTRLGVVCAAQFLLYLRQKHSQVAEVGDRLPGASEVAGNQTMQMAKRYRDSQLSIAAEGIARCGKRLSDWLKTGRLLSLDEILTGFTPPDMLRTYRKTIHRVLGTRKAPSIRSKGHEELAFVLWIMNVARAVENLHSEIDADAADVGGSENASDGPQGLVSSERLKDWIDSLARQYGLVGEQSGTGNFALLDAVGQVCWDEATQKSAAEVVARYEQYLGTSDTDIVRNYVLQTEGIATEVSFHDMLAWAVRVVREEGTEIPPNAYLPTGRWDATLDDTESAAQYVMVFEEDGE